MDDQLGGALDIVLTELSEIQGTYMTRPHIFHSLVCALIHNRFGLTGAEALIGVPVIGRYYVSREAAVNSLKRLAAAHEEKDYSEFREYVQAASEGGNRALQRSVRIKWLCRALRGALA